MIWLVLFAVIILAATFSAAYALTLLDQIVHDQLYNYGLQFSLEWAGPYWTFLRITLALLGVVVIFTAIGVVFTLRQYVHVKKPGFRMGLGLKPKISVPMSTRTVEKSPSTQKVTPAAPVLVAPSTHPKPSEQIQTPSRSSPSRSLRSETSELVRCFHCRKAFTQPLRMLDFQGDRPRIVNICPFCNEVIPTAPKQGEREQDKKFQSSEQNSKHISETLASHSTS